MLQVSGTEERHTNYSWYEEAVGCDAAIHTSVDPERTKLWRYSTYTLKGIKNDTSGEADGGTQLWYILAENTLTEC